VEQAHAAAVNALGGDLRYDPTPPPTKLKVVGIDLLSVGTITSQAAEYQEVRVEDDPPRKYRKLVLKSGRLVGAIIIGHPELFDQVTDAVAAHQDMATHLSNLRAGDWSMLG
jgi:nitrite reductase (NADH) large subunit